MIDQLVILVINLHQRIGKGGKQRFQVFVCPIFVFALDKVQHFVPEAIIVQQRHLIVGLDVEHSVNGASPLAEIRFAIDAHFLSFNMKKQVEETPETKGYYYKKNQEALRDTHWG